MSDNIKTIAFYLPQFHAIPENDEAYGIGFTEWTNTKKAKPLFEGHYQPRVPMNNNYYCLLDDTVMKKQVELAKENGIYGFCYYHYWFSGGKKLLEKPIEMMLRNHEIDMPFCLCWANENWTKRWDGGNNDVIVAQNYGDMGDVDNHVDYLCKFFRDDRYIKLDNEPLLIIYKPDIIPDVKRVIKRIRKRVKENGFTGVKIAVQYPKYYLEGVSLSLFDYYIQFQPRFVQEDCLNEQRTWLEKEIKKMMIFMGIREFGKRIRAILSKDKKYVVPNELVHRDYDVDWQKIINYKVKTSKLIAGAFVDWDNTPRNKNGLVYDNASPEKFGKYMEQLVQKIRSEYSTQFLFINAWNEWAEGAYLEPDERYGYAYLKQLKEALKDRSELF